MTPERMKQIAAEAAENAREAIDSINCGGYADYFVPEGRISTIILAALQTAVAEARRDALEEAESIATNFVPDREYTSVQRRAAFCIASDIRKLRDGEAD